MEALVVAGLLVLGLALVGFITVLRLIFGAGAQKQTRGPAVLDDAEKLAIAHEVLYRFFGSRAPADLMRELAAMRGLPPAQSDLAAVPAATSVAMPIPRPTSIAPPLAAPPPGATEHETVTREQSPPLSPAPDHAAAAHAHPLLRSFLSFENIIFLLGACLVLGGTLYVVAISWGRVPGRWQYLFLEGVVLFYGLALLGAATLLDRRLHLTPAARFLSATSGITTVAAAVVGVAAFIQYLPAGLIGGALVAAAGTGVARTVLRLAGRRPWSAPVFGLSLLLLAGAGGLIALDKPAAAGAALLAATAVACALWIGLINRPTPAVLSLAAAVPIGALLIPVAGALPPPFVAPALVAAGALVGGLGHLVGGLPLALLVVALAATAFGVAGSAVGHVAATALVGLPIALGLAWRVPLRADAGDRGVSDGRPIGVWLTAALWLVLALIWARALGLIDPGRLGVQAWVWNGLAALPFALVPFAIAIAAAAATPATRADRGLLAVAEAVGWAIVGVSLAGALAPLVLSAPRGTLSTPSVAIGVGATALAYAWARQRGDRERGGDPRWLVAHVLKLLAIWIGFRAALPAQATMAVATAAVATLLLSRQRSARIVGMAALPLAAIVAMTSADGTFRFWLAADLAGFGFAHLVRPIPLRSPTVPERGTPDWTTRFLGPPALLAALGTALFYAGAAATPLLPFERWPLALAIALLPMAAWVAWYGGPRFLTFEVMAGIALATAGGAALPGLLLTSALLFGRAPGALWMAAPAVGLLAMAAMAQRAPSEPLASCLLAAGVVFFRRPLAPRLFWIRWLGAPALIAVPMILAFYVGARSATRLPLDQWAIVLAAAMAPFAVSVVWWDRPAFLRLEILAAAWLLAGAALIASFAEQAATRGALLAASGAAAALAMGLGCAYRTGGGIARAGWLSALLLAPLAAVPMTDAPLRAPAAAVAIAAVVGLGLVSRRLRATDIGGTAVVAGLAAALWVLAVIAKQFSTGGSPARLLPAVAVVTALYGIAAVQHARRLADVSPMFVRIFAMATLALAAVSVLSGAGLTARPSDQDVMLMLAGLVAVGALSLVLAFRYRRGWPFYVAECVLAAGYGYLRTRTSWLDGFGDWDGVVACAGGFVCFAAERWLRRSRDQLGARESRILATVFPLFSALLLSSSDPRAALGMGLSAGLFLMMARLRVGQLHGWLAGLLVNLALLRVWVTAGIDSPIAYALPPGVVLMLLSHLYRDRLGRHAAVLRTIASLLVFASTSYEMFQFRVVWPAAALAAAAVVVILLGIHTRARAYLYLGFTALLLDIVANLTRWGMQDRLTGGVLGVGGGIAMFALGVIVARHREHVLQSYRNVQSWDW